MYKGQILYNLWPVVPIGNSRKEKGAIVPFEYFRTPSLCVMLVSTYADFGLCRCKCDSALVESLVYSHNTFLCNAVFSRNQNVRNAENR